MKITYEKLFEVVDVLNTLRLDNQSTKFAYVVSKNTPALQKLIKKYNEDLFDINLENSQEDEKTKSILKDAKGEFLFTKEGAKAKEIAVRALQSKEVDFDVYTLQELTEPLYRSIGLAACNIFAGVLMKEEQVKAATENEIWNTPVVKDVPKVEVAQ